MPQSNASAGRPPATSRAELEVVALDLFARRGFDHTTVDEIAAAAGVSRRTFFRYYPSKNDVVWGAFDELLVAMDRWLTDTPATTAPLEAIAEAVVRFNSLPAPAMPAHRQRMTLILRVPALQAHGTLRYADWRAVIARFAATRVGHPEQAPLPQLVGHLSLAVALAAYEQWLTDDDASLDSLLRDGFATVANGLAPPLGRPPAAAAPAPRLGEARSPQLAGRRTVLLVPLGSTEQHGPHLPLDTDTRVAIALVEHATTRLQAAGIDAWAAPAVSYGSSGEHAGFPGTLSIGQAALEQVVVELCRSADASAGVVLVSGHAGNAEPLARAVRTLRTEGRTVGVWLPNVPDGDAHAGRTETSLLLHLAPANVDVDLAEPGVTTPIGDLLPELRTHGIAGVSPNGVLGDPTGATAREGAALVEMLAESLVSDVISLLDR